jgi:PAS domain S-box-containing protein
MLDTDVKTKILLVDDRPQNLLALEAILEPLGQELVEATSGEEALKRLLTMDFAVILLDVQMPGMDGFETATVIKEREKSRHIPIIFLTAISKDEQYVFRGYTVGAVDYISKPFDPNVLRSKVAVFVDLFSKNEQLKRQAERLREVEQRERERQVSELKRASEQRYRSLAESMPQIVWTTDASGALTYCNQQWYDYTGLTPERAQDLGRATVVHPDDLAELTARWARALATEGTYDVEFRLKRADGSYRWHLERAVPVRDERGELASWIGTGTDIDDQKRAEQALSFLAEASRLLASSLDYQATLTTLAHLAVSTLADWCVVDMLEEDGSICRLAVAHADPGKADLARDLERRYLIASDAPYGPPKVVRTGEPEVVSQITDGLLLAAAYDTAHLKMLRELGFTSYMCVPLEARGRMLGALTFFSAESRRRYASTDLTLAEDLARRAATAIDNAQLYAIAQRERAELEEVNRAKDQFLATLSHELRTPLNSMLGWTRLLRSGKLDEATFARALDTIERNTKSQAQLIADLLDVSRIVTGKLALDVKPVQLASVVDAAVDSVRPVAGAKEIELLTIIDPSASESSGDAMRLQQVVWNLLSNALKFTPSGGRVEVHLGRKNGHACITVTDTGQGISPEFLPFVFERFRQADSTSTRVHGGLGLGLAIVRHLVELHGGRVDVASGGEGRGATFTVHLPLADAAPNDGAAHWTPEEKDSSFSTRPDLGGLHVLVVEDEQDGRELITTVLERCGARVTAVRNVAEALEALEEGRPDVLLSDIGLPGEDGYTLIRKVRALEAERGSQIPAAALTAYASADDRLRALAAGFQVHVAKPVEPSELTAIVASLAGRAVRT